MQASLVAGAIGLAVVAGSLVAGAPAQAAPTPSPTASATTAPRPTPAPSTAAPRPKGRALGVDLVGGAVLTLPKRDGLRDSTRVRIRSGASGAVDLIATRGTKSVHLADRVRLARSGAGYQRTVVVAVQDLPVGSWTVRARRSADTAVRAAAPGRLLVGSGKAVHVTIRPTARTLYPWKDGVLDRADLAVTGTDETGAAVPLAGSVRIDAAKLHRSRALARTGTASLAVTGLPLGPATVTATVTGPAGKAAVRTTGLTLAPTGAATPSLTRSSDTLQPVRDGFLDAATLTTGGLAVAGARAPVSGTLTIALGTTVVQRWIVPDGAAHTYTWDGRTGGAIVPGTYTATITLRGPEGPARSRARTILVTKDHLPYTVQDLFSVSGGNQQGLAVHDGLFYVGFDNGDGTSRIETYDTKGAKVGELGPIDIGHAAELSYSTTTGLLYAANGGATNPTKVWALKPDWDAATLSDPASAIVETIDLSALGNNGMIAVDDVRSQLLVFSGTAPSFTVTQLSSWAGPDGSHLIGTPMPISIVGVPQGIELVGTQLWVYTSLKGRNHLAKYELAGSTLTAAPGASADVMWAGEGEGSSTGTWNGAPAFFLGAHDTNRVGLLTPVLDE